MQRQSIIDPEVERPLLSLHRAMDVESFWKAAQQLLSAAIPNRLIRLTLQHNPVLPLIVRSTRPVTYGFFAAEPLKSYMAARPRKRFVRISDIFSNRNRLTKSAFYRRYLAPQNCRHGVVLFFWRGRRLICTITIMRTAKQGDLSPAEMKLLQQLYPQFLSALRQLGSLERAHTVQAALEESLRCLPSPTILLRWNLRLVYQNRAARGFCAVWEKGLKEARLTKACARVPPEILNRCRQLKQQWARAKRPNAPPTLFKDERVRHPRSPHLRVTIRLKRLNLAGIARPDFLIQCEDLRRQDTSHARTPDARLRYFVQLTRREREVARLICDGESNQEIADEAGLSLLTVKQHVHSILRKLEVPSRSRLMALMR
jgi:DNA-binding CsgD family transcriptional regulator